MNPPQMRCPGCGKIGPICPPMVGQMVRCPQCQTRFEVPTPISEPEPFVFPPVREKLFPLRERINDPVLWDSLHKLVPLGARATLLGSIASLGHWIYSQPPYLLGSMAAAWAWRNRRRIDFGGLFGSARFETLSALESAGMTGRDGLLLGRYQEADFRRSRALLRLVTRPLGESDAVCRHFLTALFGRRLDFSKGASGPLLCIPRGDYCHLATIAPTGAGKGINTVLPNLLNYPHSTITVDVKGENFEKSAAYRKSLGQTVVVLDPCGITSGKTATLNPLDLIDAKSPTVIEDARTLAEALVVKTAQDHDPYWNEQAVTVLTAVIVLVVVQGEPEERNLNHVRQILSDGKALDAALRVMAESADLGGMLARLGNQILAINEKERASVLSGVNRHSNFLDSQLVAASVAATSFDLRSIARRTTSVYLVLPAQYLGSLSRLMRLWINSLLLVIKQAGASEKHEVLFILDEFAQLGEMRPVEEAITLLRGFGLRIWLILQSISQLESCYSAPRAKTILGNCGTLQVFGVGDYETAEFVSKHMGDMTIASPNHQEGSSHSSGSGPGSSSSGSNRGTSYGAAGRKLLQPEEILRQPQSVFILHRGRNPILGTKIRYYEDAEFAGEGETPAPRPVSRVSAVLAGLGLIAAIYVGKDQLAWPRFGREPASVTADTSADMIRSLLSDTGQSRGRTRPAMPSRPREPVVTDCPKCHTRGPVPSDYAGEPLVCPTCNATFTVNLP